MASSSPPTASTAALARTLGPGTQDVTDTSSSSWRDCVSLKRRSLTTVKDRDWHRELVHQYGTGTAAAYVSTTACF